MSGFEITEKIGDFKRYRCFSNPNHQNFKNKNIHKIILIVLRIKK